jgi:hypothetical protein
MTTLLLSVLPILSILAVFAYAAVVGSRMYRSSGQASILGVAMALAGFTVGRLIERFGTLPQDLDDWVNYRDGANHLVTTQGERSLAVLSVEVAILFTFAAVIAFLAITLVRRDAAALHRPVARSSEVPLLATIFIFAVGVTARSKLAAVLAFMLAKAHLL